MLMHVLTIVAAAASGDPSGRVLRTEADIPAPVSQVWDAFTTKEGIESWMVPLCEIDLRYGGTLRTTYNKAEGLGGPGSITHSIVSYEPERMLAWKTTPPANASPGIRAVCEHGWTVLRFQPTSASSTHVTVSMMGIGEGDVFDQGYAHFDKGNRWTMQQLREHFEATAGQASDQVWDLVQRLEGGVWVSTMTPGQGPATFVRNTFSRGPGDATLLGRGVFASDASSLDHSSSQIYRLGKHGPVVFHEVNHEGAHSDGSLRREGDTLIWEWNAHAPSGVDQTYLIRQSFTGSDAYRMTMSDASGRPVVELDFARQRDPAAGWPGLPASVDPSTFAWAGPEEGLAKTSIVAADASRVYRQLSSGEGWKEFLGVADAQVEMRPGGRFEISFGDTSPPGQRGSEGCQVLAFVPDRMIAFTWNAPPKFAPERPRHTWVVITLADAGEGRTQVRLDHLGFGRGGSWPEVRSYFDRAWGNVLAALEGHFAATR